jgi:purine nucleosidase
VKITELVRLHGKNLNILALGPLTNLSLAVLIDSTLRESFNNLFITGGSYNNLGNSGNAAEYNFRADPVAAKNVIFYYKNITLITLETEYKFLENLKLDYTPSEQFKDIADLVNLLSQEGEETRMRHSFLGFIAAVVSTNLNLVKTKTSRPVDVDIIGRFTRGALAIEKYEYLRSGKFNDVVIVEDLDWENFYSTFRNIVA